MEGATKGKKTKQNKEQNKNINLHIGGRYCNCFTTLTAQVWMSGHVEDNSWKIMVTTNCICAKIIHKASRVGVSLSTGTSMSMNCYMSVNVQLSHPGKQQQGDLSAITGLPKTAWRRFIYHLNGFLNAKRSGKRYWNLIPLGRPAHRWDSSAHCQGRFLHFDINGLFYTSLKPSVFSIYDMDITLLNCPMSMFWAEKWVAIIAYHNC